MERGTKQEADPVKRSRQIGKTWVMQTFGKECFKYCVTFDFDRQQELKSGFQTTKDSVRLIKELSLYCERHISLSRLD